MEYKLAELNTIYVLDTNVFLTDGMVIKKLNNAEIVIPLCVLGEIDKHKNDRGETGLNARRAIRVLDELRDLGNLGNGVRVNDVKVIVDKTGQAPEADDRIIEVASRYTRKYLNRDVIIISNDINLRVKADAHGVKAQKYSTSESETEDDIFSGVRFANVDSKTIDEIHDEGAVDNNGYGLNANEFLHLRSHEDPSQTAIARFHEDGSIKKVHVPKDVFGITSKNMEQACALDALLDTNIPLVTLMGKAGSGKTLLAIAAALEMVTNRHQYERVMVLRAPIPMGKDLGYLPGTLEEKMDVWAGPIFDALGVLLSGASKSNMQYLFDNGLLSIGPPTYIRGRSLHRCVVVIDEAQGLTPHEIKTIVTRMGADSKLIVTGDIYQIDNQSLSAMDNGLTHLVEKFKPEWLAAHIKLTKSERSDLAARAAEIL